MFASYFIVPRCYYSLSNSEEFHNDECRVHLKILKPPGLRHSSFNFVWEESLWAARRYHIPAARKYHLVIKFLLRPQTYYVLLHRRLESCLGSATLKFLLVYKILVKMNSGQMYLTMLMSWLWLIAPWRMSLSWISTYVFLHLLYLLFFRKGKTLKAIHMPFLKHRERLWIFSFTSLCSDMGLP